MKGVGEYLKIVGKALNDPIKSLGTLRDFVVRKVTKTITRDRLSMVHETLRPEAIIVEDQVAKFAGAVELLLRRHGKEIVKREFAQKRIANCSMELFSMMATLSRVTQLIAEKGETDCEQEINICKTHCSRSQKRLLEILAEIDANDDENIKEIAQYARDAGGYRY